MSAISPTAGPRAQPDAATIYRRYFDYAWTNLRRLGVPDSGLEDPCHDVFLVVHRRLDSFDGRSSMRTWLFGITRRVAADHRRSQHRELRKRLALERPPASSNNPSERWSQRLWLQNALDMLEPERREAFVMLQLTQLTAKEASAVTGINANTLSARLRAARRDIAEALGHDEAELGRAVALGAVEDKADDGVRKRVLAGLAPLGFASNPTAGTPSAGGVSGLVAVGSLQARGRHGTHRPRGPRASTTQPAARRPRRTPTRA